MGNRRLLERIGCTRRWVFAKTLGRSPDVATQGSLPSVGSLTIVVALALGASFNACAAGFPALTTTVTASTPVPGEPVTISWSISNPSSTAVFGTVQLAFDGVAVNGGHAINVNEVKPGKTLTGSFSAMPYPGLNTATLTMVNTSSVVVPGTGTTKPPTQMSADGSTSTATATGGKGATHNVPVQTTVAQGSVTFNASPLSDAFGALLTDEQRAQVMKDYAPLLLYSYDHGGDEKYSPIDVMSYALGSTLALPNETLDDISNPVALLNPRGGEATGTISASQAVLPVPFYVQPKSSPASSVRVGKDWKTVMSDHAGGHDDGLYAHAFLVDAKEVNDDADPALNEKLRVRYNCLRVPCAQVIKIEYWQFYGFSHDFDTSGLKLGALGGEVQSFTDHDGDWCTVQLYVDAAWWHSARPDRAILAVYHYLHGKQAGFDMAKAQGAPGHVTVPTRAAKSKAPIFTALQFAGPNYGQSPEFSIKALGHWLPPAGKNETTQEAIAQNNVLQLAADTSADGSGSSPSAAEFRHPVAYVEWGGHEFWPTPKWSLFGASKHNGTGQYAYFGTGAVDLRNDTVAPDPKASDEVNIVRFFAGYWGTNGGSGPPQGPSLHKEWYWHLGDGCDPDPSGAPVSNACLGEFGFLREIETVPSRPF